MKLIFEMEKPTKNTIKFKEILENDLDAPKVGAIYLQKAALKELNWAEGKNLEIEIRVVEK